MKLWKCILWPLAFLYGLVSWFRRWLYSAKILQRKKVNLATIIVGNLQVGGSGKTPMTMWLANHLKEQFKIAILSRGYGRKTTGFREVIISDTAENCGDEPLEMRISLPDTIKNYVCEDRVKGIHLIEEKSPETNLVLLDDGYQHLNLHGDFYILLTEYRLLFTNDLPLPAGRLREFSSAAKDANTIVVTKCPNNLNVDGELRLFKELSKYRKPIFYTAYQNSLPIDSAGNLLDSKVSVLLISGLANNGVFVNWAKTNFNVTLVKTYSDHFAYSKNEMEMWIAESKKAGINSILTTRKDAMRMPKDTAVFFAIFTSHTTPEFLFESEHKFLSLFENLR